MTCIVEFEISQGGWRVVIFLIYICYGQCMRGICWHREKIFNEVLESGVEDLHIKKICDCVELWMIPRMLVVSTT